MPGVEVPGRDYIKAVGSNWNLPIGLPLNITPLQPVHQQEIPIIPIIIIAIGIGIVTASLLVSR